MLFRNMDIEGRRAKRRSGRRPPLAVAFVVPLAAALLLSSCGDEPEDGQVDLVTWVQMTKMEFCPGHNLGQGIGEFFLNPRWEYGRADDERWFVTATGELSHEDRTVEAALRFVYQPGNSALGFDGLFLDGERQEQATAVGLFGTICQNLANPG